MRNWEHHPSFGTVEVIGTKHDSTKYNLNYSGLLDILLGGGGGGILTHRECSCVSYQYSGLWGGGGGRVAESHFR